MANSLLDRFGAVSDAIGSGTFDPAGSNYTSFNFGTSSGDLPALPTLPSLFAPSATSAGNKVVSAGGAGESTGVSPTAATAVTSATAAQPVNASTQEVKSGSIADYFLRAVIIILGFIFVAIGLNMFRPGLVPNPIKAVTR